MRVNPFWHQKNQAHVKQKMQNSLGIYLEIRQLNGTFEIHTWDGRKLGAFINSKHAETFARNYRTPLMPTSAIQDIRFIPDPKLVPPKPKKHEKVVMEPISIKQTEIDFIPIKEDEEIVVAHPDDIVVF